MSFEKLAELMKTIEREILRIMPTPNHFSNERLRYILKEAGGENSKLRKMPPEKKSSLVSPVSNIFSKEFENMITPDIFTPISSMHQRAANHYLILPLPSFQNHRAKEEFCDDKISYSVFFSPKPAPLVALPLPSRPLAIKLPYALPRPVAKSQFAPLQLPAASVSNQ